MSFETEILDHFNNGHEKYLRNLSVDCVIFGFHENELKVLLLYARHAGLWALPGGFVLKEEHIDSAAARVLQKRTGLKNIYLQQFHVFSKPERSTKKIYQHFLTTIGIDVPESWMFDRFLSVGFTALLDFSKVKAVPDIFSSSFKWFNVMSLPELLLDHREILDTALQNLRADLNYHPVGYNLLPEKFTMPELQKLYETILDRNLDRRNFQRKIVSAKILKKLDETKKGVAHKAPNFYKFDLKNYKKVLKGGMGFEL